MLGKAIHPKIAYRGEVLQSIDGAYGSKEERKMHEFFDGIEGENIEIGDGVKPEDVSEEDAPIIKYVHSVIKDALEMRALIFIWNLWKKVSHTIPSGWKIARATRPTKTTAAIDYFEN